MKKFVSMILALALVLTSCVAFAATPSFGGGNLTEAKGFVVYIVDENELPDWFSAKAEAVAATENVLDCFDDATKAGVVGAFDTADDLTVYELNGVACAGYEESMGDVAVEILFPTVFTADQQVAVVLGFNNGETMDWAVLDASALENGDVEMTFTADMLTRMMSEVGMLLVIAK